MDPVTAVGLAASILQFIDFSWSLVQGSYEIYRSEAGTTPENAHIRNVILDLRQVTEDMDSDIKGQTKHEKALRKLAQKCQDLSSKLAKILEELKMKGDTRWESLRIKWKSMRKEKDVAIIEKRLIEYRAEIMLRLNLMICDQNSSLKQGLDKIQREGAKLANENAKEMSALRDRLMEVIQRLQEDARKTTAAVEPSDVETVDTSSLKTLHASLIALCSTSRNLPMENLILRRLYFDAINRREDDVVDAESGTFKWILGGKDRSSADNSSSADDRSSVEDEENPAEVGFSVEEQHGREVTRTALESFLKEHHGVYFISGKAGSGKSTLMKFLGHHAKVQELLESWAGSKKLIFARFFFWNSGDKLQMSLEGFYRSLLFDILKKCPKLMERVFPGDWNANSASDLLNAPYRIGELKSALQILVRTTSFPNHRFCFFIDGLDEFEGRSQEHVQLARDLKAWGNSGDVKIVCSARPYTEFVDTFTDAQRRIELHNLTKSDIRRFVTEQIRKELRERADGKKLDEFRQQIGTIVDLADGVFLWARLVVHSLLEGIRHDDQPKSLEERIKQTPQNLNELFTKMLHTVDRAIQRRSNTMLLLAARYPERKNALLFTWLDDLADKDFPQNLPFQTFSDEEIERRVKILRRQLDVHTKGLLEIREDQGKSTLHQHRVEFLHRSVGEYLGSEWKPDDSQCELCIQDLHGTLFRLSLALHKVEGSLLEAYDTVHEITDWGDLDKPLPHRWLDELGVYLQRASQSPTDNYRSRSSKAYFGTVWRFILRDNPRITFSMSHTTSTFNLGFMAIINQEAYLRLKLTDGAIKDLIEGDWCRLFLACMDRNMDVMTTKLLQSRNDLAFVRFQFRRKYEADEGATGTSIPIWLVFVRYLAGSVVDATRNKLLYDPDPREMECQGHILEHFLALGLARNTIIVVALDENGETDADPWTPAEESLGYIELYELLDMMDPPPSNMKTLRQLLSSDASRDIWGIVTGPLRRLTRRQIGSSFRNQYEHIDLWRIREPPKGDWRVWGIVTEKEQFLGSAECRIC